MDAPLHGDRVHASGRAVMTIAVLAHFYLPSVEREHAALVFPGIGRQRHRLHVTGLLHRAHHCPRPAKGTLRSS